MAKSKTRQQAVDENYEAFQKLLPDLLVRARGKYALMRNGKVVEFFDTPRDAMIYGQNEFSDELFSVQQVTSRVVDLGYFSHAVPYENV